MAGLCSIIITLCFLLPLSSGGREIYQPAAAVEFIRVRCNTTEFPHLCVSSLSSYAPVIGVNALKMADAALNVTLRTARSASFMTDKVLTGGAGRLPPRQAAAARDCAESLSDSVVSLRESLNQMGRLNGNELVDRIEDVKTWVSSALTDDTTCMDGLPAGDVRAAVRVWVLTTAHLTSNALALINDLSPDAVNSP